MIKKFIYQEKITPGLTVSETLVEEIADRLRRRILRGELGLGTDVRERDIAADMGVSRTPSAKPNGFSRKRVW